MAKSKAIKDLDFPTSIRLPGPLKAALKEEADEQRRSLSWIIIEILEQWRAFAAKKKKYAAK